MVSSGSPLERKIGFSRAMRVGNIVSIAGTAPISASGGTDGIGDVYRQARRCLEIIESALVDADVTLNSVICTRVFLTDIDRWNEAAEAHGEYFANIGPACTFVEVSRFIDPDCLVEIEADAVVP